MMLQVFSPIDGALVLEREPAGESEVAAALERARQGAARWSALPLEERLATLERFVDALVARKDEIAAELTTMMGRPIRWTPGEVGGFEQRARTMLQLAPEALAQVEAGPGRFIDRVPLGVVLVVAAWNYPYLISVNSVVPALAAGNAVLLKHSTQTMACAERFAQAFAEAGLPDGVFQVLHMTHSETERLVASGEVDTVLFTGSVEGGRILHRAAAGTFNPMGLELGGKDPAYVREDADLEFAAENLAEGAFFNSGQSCCGIERIYVHQSRYDELLELLCRAAHFWKLGDPRDPATTLGPMIRPAAAEAVRQQVEQAREAGAQTLLNYGGWEGAYMPPEILIDVHHGMEIMTEETFGPVVGVMPVADDEEAVLLMNDSQYGLTASIWTNDLHRAQVLGKRLQTGTVFANRCDYLDPALAWTGVKNSGRGCTLSRLGYEHLTRPKSYHLRAVPQ
jgi:acyl-CoA reductase-like NAD-dependent aldehyde dehydrogenase